MAPNSGSLYIDVCKALGLNQREMAELLEVSLRTVQRLDANLSSVGGPTFARMAGVVHPRDPELAERLAARAGTTLEKLGIRAPAASKPVSPRAADSVVCAAADVMQLPPSALRPVLLAAFVRAREMGLTVETVAAALEAGERSVGKPGGRESPAKG